MINAKKDVVGIWFIGARGAIASSVICGLGLLKDNLAPKTGLITEREPYNMKDLIEWGQIIPGGCDVIIQDAQLIANKLIYEKIIPFEFAERLPSILKGTDTNIDKALTPRKGTKRHVPFEIIDYTRDQIGAFKTRNGLDRVMVIDCSSTEVVRASTSRICTFRTWSELELYLIHSKEKIPYSLLYATSALLEGCAYINFTPNIATEIPALLDLANIQRIPHAGKDGKTGETLVKTALAPFFDHRNLEVLTWFGFNMLGNSDGRNLENPSAKKAKIVTKNQSLKEILHHSQNLHTNVSIDYVPSLGDWKIAWDFIHFRGFLNTKMSMDFTWRGCDTTLAAPLVLDLIRLVEFDWRKGLFGPLTHLAAFFKAPINCTAHDFHLQIEALKSHFSDSE